MRVAAYQCPLLPPGSMDAIGLIRRQVKVCESEGVTILCCPEAVLGGLADNAPAPDDLAIDAGGDRLAEVLAPLASRTVTTIVGFTELAAGGRLFNSAAVLRDGVVVGLYRKHHPAINRSIYRGADRIPVFEVGGLTFGVIICNDSNFVEPARTMLAKGAAALFVPTNNALLPNRAGLEVVARARQVDIAWARENGVSVIRADVSGRAGGLLSYGCSEIVDAGGAVLRSAPPLAETLLVADIEFAPCRR
jgi:5-aminopentanamidase